MPDIEDNDEPETENWTGPAAARRFTVWIILWMLIAHVIITMIFTFV